MNYFEWFELPVAFLLDEADLRQRFYRKSKALHPDFHTLADEAAQQEALAQSSFNNEAYRVLSDSDRRMQYVLGLYGALAEEGQNQIPSDFLMEMMEINEALMELEFDFDAHALQRIQAEAERTESTLYQEIIPLLQAFAPLEPDTTLLEKIKDYYLKKRYLLRIKENLSTFAHRQQ